MNPEKWNQINEIFHSALDVKTGDRFRFVESQSNGDEAIFTEVKKLLNAHEEAKSFIQKPVAGDALQAISDADGATMIAPTPMVSTGELVGHFEVIRQVGRGGMGEVFLARDKNLERDVAVKILPKDFTADTSRVNRFIREAKAASALNHPNILTIHEIGEFEGTRFIASEFVDGQTLTTFISSERLSLKKILDIAKQIVSALQTAHEAGIVHRDIKPDNVMIRRDRLVKVLDFGLAKLLENDASAKSANPSLNSTIPGLIMGTPNYMSPEQARGTDIDFRTDIFSFGVVLYEMLAGKLPFGGESVNDVIASVLTKDPISLREVNDEVPPELERIVEKCLQKDKQDRYQTAKSLSDELENFSEDLQVQERLEKTFTPNREGEKTHIFKATTVDAARDGAVTKQNLPQRKSLKSYLMAGAAAALIATAGFFGYQYLSPSKQIESVAVMPFVNESGNADIEYLSDGMAETLIKNLSNVPNLSVKARSSVFRYKGQEPDLKKISAELGVQAIVTGRITQRGDEITLSLDLVEAETEKNLWNERYTRKQSDIINLQNEIAKDVSENLKLRLSGAETAKLADNGTTNPEAYQSYLKGRYFLTKGAKDSPSEALKYFQNAVSLDSKFALGYAGLADCYTLLGTVMQARMTPEETMPQAKIAAQKAIELDPNLSEAYTSLAWVAFRYDWDWAEADKNFQKSIELNPNNAQAHHWYAEFLAVVRREDERAIAELKKAVALEPFNLLIIWNLAKTYLDAGKNGEALVEAKKIYEMDKNFSRNYRVLRNAYERNGMNAEAFEIFLLERVQVKKDKPERIDLYKKLYSDGKYSAAVLKSLEFELEDDPNMNAGFKAVIYSAFKDKEKTLASLEDAYSQRVTGVIYLKQSQFDFLRDEPRYQELVRKLNFPAG